MTRLIPVPSLDFIPVELQEGAGPLTDMLDAQFTAWLDDAFGLETLRDPARIPAQCIDEAGYQLAAGIYPGDSERVRRYKLATAAMRNAERGLWEKSVKPTVEARSGAIASIFVDSSSDYDFILSGSVDEGSKPWGSMGGISGSEVFGIVLSSGSEEESGTTVKGEIRINAGSSEMSAYDVASLVTELLDLVPAYYKAYVGYVESGEFVAYPNGEVN